MLHPPGPHRVRGGGCLGPRKQTGRGLHRTSLGGGHGLCRARPAQLAVLAVMQVWPRSRTCAQLTLGRPLGGRWRAEPLQGPRAGLGRVLRHLCPRRLRAGRWGRGRCFVSVPFAEESHSQWDSRDAGPDDAPREQRAPSPRPRPQARPAGLRPFRLVAVGPGGWAGPRPWLLVR